MNTMRMVAAAMLAAATGVGAARAAEAAAPAESVVAPGAKVEKLAGDFKFTEGATCDAAGNVFFVDQPNNRIHKWSIDGKLSVFLEPSGRANGMCFDAKGNLIACADEKTELWSIAPDGKVTVLLGAFEGRPFNGPNDVWVHPDGSLYFTDPFYKRPWWTHQEPPQASKGVYRLAPGAAVPVRVAADFNQPNGITGTPDGKTLYVAEIGAKKIWRFDIRKDGTLGDRSLVCEAPSDGMTIDREGRLYLTNGDGVVVVAPDGRILEKIAVPEKWTANVCFGGPDRRTLFITASTGLYSVRLRTAGANPAK